MSLQSPDALFAPDAGPDMQPYTCSYHTLRLADGRLLVLDIVRSDNNHRRCLRVFLSDSHGKLRALNVESDSAAWSPFATGPADLDRSRNVLGRNPQWVAGDVRRGDCPDLGLQHVAFELTLRVESSTLRSDTLGLALLRMTVEDHPRVYHRGWVEIDGERITIDGPGAVSVHIGEQLCNYAYIATPPSDDPAPAVLLASVCGDNFRLLGDLLGQTCATYSYGWHGLPALSITAGSFEHPIHLRPGHRLHLHPGPPVLHTLLGVPTITALATARYHHHNLLGDDDNVELGQVIIEGRGEPFYGVLAELAAHR
ncbi:hypothetical protein [Nannocystis sp.]|uniref:hypothetical protein n=1 Tax=Nannocystis sp. TaxID=1962667 RepID=UPI0025E3563E|nr:hypothetical protein [Nannocystis sp.]MBK7825648.1 hypothetical protein [Nannocystis sp.]